VYVADRESDFLDWMIQANALRMPVDWLIRSAYNQQAGWAAGEAVGRL
jgi:hypothetical protein